MGGIVDQLHLALHDVRQRRWLALAVTAVICLIGWAGAWFMPNRYESEARVFVQMQTILPEKIGLSQQARQKDVDRVKRTLTSTLNLEKVIRATDLADMFAGDAAITQAAEDLRRHIDVVEQHENLFKISAKIGFARLSDAENARMARIIVQKMIDIFVEDNLSGDRQETTQSLAFLDRQIAEVQEQLRLAEARRSSFERETFGGEPGGGSVQQRLDQARAELTRIQTDLLAAQSSPAGVSQQMTDAAARAGGGASPAAIQVAHVQAQLNDALGRGWTEQHPDVVALRRQLARAQAQATRAGAFNGRQDADAWRGIAADRQALIASLMARKQAVEADMMRITAALAANPDVAAEQERLNRDFDAARDQYAALLEKREAVRLQEQVVSTTDTMSFRVVDPPSVPRGAALPDRSLIFLGIAWVAMGAGMGVALAHSRAHPTFHSAQQLAQVTGLPVLSAVPEVPTRYGENVVLWDKRRFRLAVMLLNLIFFGLVAMDQLGRGGLV